MWWSGWWPSGYVEQSRYLYDHELVVFMSGISRVVVGEQSFTCPAGDVLIIPPGVRHWTRSVLDSRVERYCFHFDWIWGMPAVTPSYTFESTGKYRPGKCKLAPPWLTVKMPFHVTGMSLQRLHLLLHPLAECDGISWKNSLKQHGLFAQLLSEVLLTRQPVKTSANGGKSLRMVKKLKLKIESDYRQDLVMTLLAKEAKVTPAHMARAFKMVVGISPLEYMHRLRVEDAYRLLSSGSMNISEVAATVGFADANYFTRLFRKKMGMTPSKVATNLGK